MDHPDQIKGKSVRLLRDFAKAFNKALNYRIGNVAEILEGIISINKVASCRKLFFYTIIRLVCVSCVVLWFIIDWQPSALSPCRIYLISLTDIDRSGGSIDDYYWGYWVAR